MHGLPYLTQANLKAVEDHAKKVQAFNASPEGLAQSERQKAEFSAAVDAALAKAQTKH